MKSYADSRSGVRFKQAAIALIFGIVLLVCGHALAQTVNDDFNDNRKDKTLWGPDYVYHNGVLKEQKQRLGYTVSTPSKNYEYTYWPLITSRGPYDSYWEVQMDLFNGTNPSKSNQVNSFGISVVKCGNDSNEIYAELYATRLGDAPSRKGFYAGLWSEDVDSGWADTSDLSLSDPLAGTVRLSFDSIGKVFRTSYDTGDGWEQFGSFGVSGAAGGTHGNGNWAMTDTDQFCIAVYGYSKHMPIAKGKMYGDNFQATGVTAPLTTRILKPNGGETVPAGELYTVEWEAPAAATKFKLQYSLDNGSTWKAIAPDFLTGSSYDWPVPVPSNNKDKCLVKLDAYWIGYNGNDVKIGTDVSDAPFTVEVLRLNSPNGGEAPLTSGTQYPITWTTSPNVPPVKRVQLSYTLDNGATWRPIDTTGDPSDDGRFLWTVPGVTTEKDRCRVKIVLKDASGKTLGSDGSDGVFTVQPGLRLEPYAYRAYLQWGGPLETVFTIQKPKGWEVIISGMCTTLAFLIRDPDDPLRQIFYFGSVRPVYLTQAQKDFDLWYCSVAPLYCPSWTDAPVVDPLTAQNFFSHWPQIASMQNATSFMAEFPRLQGLELVSVMSQTPLLPLTGADAALVRGVFTDGDPINPRAAQGQFLGTVAADPFASGTGSGYMVFGAAAPVSEFKNDIDKMVESLNSFTISNVYFDWCEVQMEQQWGAVADIGETLREASDIIWEGWLSRTASQDIMAYEYNDVVRGVEKVWDPDTQRVYEFEAGWYDQYLLNPELYNISTLEPLPDGRLDLWEGTIFDGPTYVYEQ